MQTTSRSSANKLATSPSRSVRSSAEVQRYVEQPPVTAGQGLLGASTASKGRGVSMSTKNDRLVKMAAKYAERSPKSRSPCPPQKVVCLHTKTSAFFGRGNASRARGSKAGSSGAGTRPSGSSNTSVPVSTPRRSTSSAAAAGSAASVATAARRKASGSITEVEADAYGNFRQNFVQSSLPAVMKSTLGYDSSAQPSISTAARLSIGRFGTGTSRTTPSTAPPPSGAAAEEEPKRSSKAIELNSPAAAVSTTAMDSIHCCSARRPPGLRPTSFGNAAAASRCLHCAGKHGCDAGSPDRKSLSLSRMAWRSRFRTRATCADRDGSEAQQT
mmetsp:Transcript_125139/g.399994  ORF Transcript_125139/g.399994 Transcript_125139/m.399994 type:complete len:329 (-) Transcript_125139:418-1404(-)